jgi:hypothetical protein
MAAPSHIVDTILTISRYAVFATFSTIASSCSFSTTPRRRAAEN